MTRRPRQRDRELLRRRRGVPRNEPRAGAADTRVSTLMSTLGKRTLAAAEALPQRPRPADLQSLPRQLADAIRLEAHAAAGAPAVEQVIGKLTRSLAAATDLASVHDAARPAPDAATTRRPPDNASPAGARPAGEAAPAAEPQAPRAGTPREQAAGVI